MTQQTIASNVNFPTREDIESIRVGAQALDAFGKMRKVVSVQARKEDIHGKLFCCYSTALGDDGASCTMSQKQDEITRHCGIRMTSHELCTLERRLRAERVA